MMDILLLIVIVLLVIIAFLIATVLGAVPKGFNEVIKGLQSIDDHLREQTL